MRTGAVLGLALALLAAASCGKPPAALAPGQAGAFVLSADLAYGREWSGPAPIQVFCPATDLLTCKAEGAFATSSPVRLPFTVSASAKPGLAVLAVPVRFTFAKRGGAAVIRDEQIAAKVEIRPGAAAGTVEVPLSGTAR